MQPHAQLFEKLPDEFPEAAFILLGRVKSAFLSGYKDSEEAQFMQACSVLSAYYDASSVKIPQPISDSFGAANAIPGAALSQAKTRWARSFAGFEADILAKKFNDDRETALKIIKKTQFSFGYAVLTNEEKQEIADHLESIRKIIEESDLDDRKKNALFQRISDLLAETNKNGTKTDRFFAFLGDAAFVVNGMAKQAAPALEELRKILEIVMRSRAKSEGVSLPAPDQIPQLPAPK